MTTFQSSKVNFLTTTRLPDVDGVHIAGTHKSPDGTPGDMVAFGGVSLLLGTASLSAIDGQLSGALILTTAAAIFGVWRAATWKSPATFDVKLTSDTISIRSVGSKDFQHFERGAAHHRFLVEPHMKSQQEIRQREEMEVHYNKKRAYDKVPFVFTNSTQVVMRYGERRIPISSFDEFHAEYGTALLLRLQQADEELIAKSFTIVTASAGDGSSAVGNAPPVH